jgi:alkylhydroperoxidase/carboxymuconolactone decarboxylase family protein YurZ
MAMTDDMFLKATAELAKRRKSLAPEVTSAFHDFSKAVFREGTLSRKHKPLIAVAVAEMRAGGACAHSLMALDTLDEEHRHAPHE